MTDLSRIPGLQGPVVPTLDGRFFRPPLPDGHVLRPRLCERLSAGLSGRLLLVCAPAGFGKSSLAVEFCQSLPPAWQSLWLGSVRGTVIRGGFSNACSMACSNISPNWVGRPWAC